MIEGPTFIFSRLDLRTGLNEIAHTAFQYYILYTYVFYNHPTYWVSIIGIIDVFAPCFACYCAKSPDSYIAITIIYICLTQKLEINN